MPRSNLTASPMFNLRAVLAGLVLACTAGSPGAAGTEAGPPARPALNGTAAGEARVIVKFRSARQASALSVAASPASVDATPRRAQALGQRVGLRLSDGPAVSADTQVVQAAGLSNARLMQALAADPQVEYVVEDRRRRAHAAVVSDPLFAGGPSVSPAAGQWYLQTPNTAVVSSVNAESAWALTTGRADIVVAVLDSGVRFSHPDLDGKLLAGYDFVSEAVTSNDGDGRDANPTDPGDWITADENTTSPTFGGCGVQDSSWHGTQVAGLIGAATNNTTGMAGMGRHVRVLPVRVLGKCGGYDADIVAGMRWAGGLRVSGVPDNPTPARVINLSLGEVGSCTVGADATRPGVAKLYLDAINELRQAGVVVVASAGNDNGAVNMPGNCAGVVSVGGLRHAGDKSGFSSLGPEVSIAAPAGNCVNATGECLYPILSTTNTGTTGPACPSHTTGSGSAGLGTSFSAPLVSGTVALMLSAQPTLTPNRVLELLRSTARAFPARPAGATTPACSTNSSILQVECHCTTATCGAGMLDAGAAVRAAAGTSLVARLGDSSTRIPLSSNTTLDASGSSTGAGRTLVGYQWRITDGAAVAGFSSSTTGSVALLGALGSGLATVELTVTDSSGATSRSAAVLRTGTVPAAVCGPDENDAFASEGGGAMRGGWLAGLAAVVGLLAWSRRRAGSSAVH
ncbi:MAG: S8 family peptidase [Sphaerotilus sp.]|nr:S8 family peptidase [Sphaerotilus sp.]